jgi:glycolate oxidase iron-sulfur subunit
MPDEKIEPIEKTPLEVLKKYEDVVAACNRCGFCTSFCPTYNASGSEAQSPRGRNQLFRALLEGKVKDPVDALESIDSCLLCGECTSVCFSEVPTAHLMMQARNYINQIRELPRLVDFFFRKILVNPPLFALLLKTMFLGKRLGIATLLKKTGLLRRISPALSRAESMTPTVPIKFLLEFKACEPHLISTYQKELQKILIEERDLQGLKKKKEGAALATQPRRSHNKPTIAYLPVCGSQYIRPSIGLATINLFERLGLAFTIPNVVCCGLPAASTGAGEHTLYMAQENISRLEMGDYETIVADDSSCTAHVKDYPAFFPLGSTWLTRAQGTAQKVRELSTFLMQRGLREQLEKKTWTGGVVAYHDPCKAQYAQKITQPPRDLLKGIPRLSLVVIKDADQCCGGGGTYSFVHPEMSQAVLASKIKNIIASGCKIVVTSSTSCLLQLAAGLREAGSSIEALHLSEFLVRVLEKEK